MLGTVLETNIRSLNLQFLKIKSIPNLFWSSPEPLTLKPPFISVVMLAIGLLLFGLGEALLVASGAGVSPWTVFAQGFSKVTNWSIGFSTFTISLCVMFLWIPLRQKPGVGTLLNIIIISLVLDLSAPYLPVFDTLGLQIAEAALGVIVTGVGGGIYLIANLGPGPRDGLMTGLNKQINLSLALIRTILELSAVGIGFYLGGIVGIGTIIYAVGIGFSVSLGLFIIGKFYK